MNALTSAVLMGWPLVMVILCIVLGSSRALIVGFIAGWLTLPVASLSMRGFFDLDKSSVLSLGGLIAVAITNPRFLLEYRPRGIDLPVCMLCVSGFLSALANGIPFYDATTELARLTLLWAVPWVLGRLSLSELGSFEWLAKCLAVGGLLYAPLCLWEVRMSPSLHRSLYGVSVYDGIAYLSSLGSWGSRPSVFMRNPLELGMVMTPACLFAFVLWRQSQRSGMESLAQRLTVLFLLVVVVLCKNLGATLLLLVGVVGFELTIRRKTLLPLAVIGLVAPGYMLSRGMGLWDGKTVVALAELVHADRASSFDFRLANENALVEKALQRPVLGWSGWGRSRVYDEEGRDVSVTDGLWIIALGMYGLAGLGSLVLMLTLPLGRMARALDRTALRHSKTYPLTAAVTILLIMTLDFLVNNFPSPPLLLMAGGLAGVPPIALDAKRRVAVRLDRTQRTSMQR